MSKYTIRLDTPGLAQAGTNADVEARIRGNGKVSPWRVLDNPGDDREQGSKDYYKFYVDENVEPVEALEIRVKKWDHDSPNWYLAFAYVANVPTGDLYEFHHFEWIDPPAKWLTIRLGSPKRLGKIPWNSPFQW